MLLSALEPNVGMEAFPHHKQVLTIDTFTQRRIMAANDWSLRDLYRTLETPGTNRLHDAHAVLDSAVRAAYGMKDSEDTLAFLLCLNLELANKEAQGRPVTEPGLPATAPEKEQLISPDCVQPPG
jgi:hypothetical protein